MSPDRKSVLHKRVWMLTYPHVVLIRRCYPSERLNRYRLSTGPTATMWKPGGQYGFITAHPSDLSKRLWQACTVRANGCYAALGAQVSSASADVRASHMCRWLAVNLVQLFQAAYSSCFLREPPWNLPTTLQLLLFNAALGPRKDTFVSSVFCAREGVYCFCSPP